MYDSFRVEIKQYRDHRNSPPISFYVIDDDAPTMEPVSCVHCKRTIHDMKGQIVTIISTPMPIEDFGIAVNVLCKLCKQQYRLLINSKVYQG